MSEISLFSVLSPGLLITIALAIIIVILLLGGVFTVQTAEAAIITRFGKFVRIAEAGLNWKWPLIEQVAGRANLKVQPIGLNMETKTRDNVFVTIPIVVQIRIRPERVYDAFYRLADPATQIRSYVEQVILGHIPSLSLDEVFERRSEIAVAVKRELDGEMAGFGYEIVGCQVTDIVPDPKVKAAMNEINAAQRQQAAATAKGEADKILLVKKAEAEAESKRLQGVGIANERRAIARGLEASIRDLQTVVGDAPVTEVMQLILITQYFDTLKNIGQSSGTNTLFLSHAPGSLQEISDQITQSILLRNARPSTPPTK